MSTAASRRIDDGAKLRAQQAEHAAAFVNDHGMEWAKAHAVDDHVCDLDHKDEIVIAEFVRDHLALRIELGVADA